MKIVHLCLSCFYIDGYSYQENMLVRQHVAEGHDVVVIASTENYGADRKHTYVDPSTYMGTDGARVIRLPYRSFLPHRVMRKLRMHPGVLALLESERPDSVMFHGLCGHELLTAAEFKRRHPRIPVYADSHEYHGNSARNWGSWLLHKLYYRPIIRRSVRHFDKILCISLENMSFLETMYCVPRSLMEFYPLGGHILTDQEYRKRRQDARARLRLPSDCIAVLQTGKMGVKKKILESLAAFAQTPSRNLRLLLAGSLDPSIEERAMKLIASDDRVSFLGWASSEELLDLLCLADVYLQPGTQSATMQMSLCARCPVILDDVPSHKPYVDGNGWLINDVSEVPVILKKIASDPGLLPRMSDMSLTIARRLLDYRVLARRIAG